MKKLLKMLIIMATTIAVVILGSTLTAPAASASDQYGTNWNSKHGVGIPWGGFTQITAPRSSSLTMATKILNHPTAPGAGASAACAVLVYPWAIAACVTLMQYHWESTKSAARKVKNGSTQDCLALRIYDNANIWPFATPVSRVTCYFGLNIPPGQGGGGGGGGGGGSWKQMAAYAPIFAARVADRLADNGGGHNGGGGGSW